VATAKLDVARLRFADDGVQHQEEREADAAARTRPALNVKSHEEDDEVPPIGWVRVDAQPVGGVDGNRTAGVNVFVAREVSEVPKGEAVLEPVDAAEVVGGG
jgi:hypothetical protein